MQILYTCDLSISRVQRDSFELRVTAITIREYLPRGLSYEGIQSHSRPHFLIQSQNFCFSQQV